MWRVEHVSAWYLIKKFDDTLLLGQYDSIICGTHIQNNGYKACLPPITLSIFLTHRGRAKLKLKQKCAMDSLQFQY